MNENEKISVLVVEPGKAPRPAEISNSAGGVEAVIGGEFQIGCFPPHHVLLISREAAEGLTPNRRLPDGSGYLSGTFLLCGIPDMESGENFASLTAKQQLRFQQVFEQPGEFMMVGSRVYSDPDDVADHVYSLWDSMDNGETVVLTKWGGAAKGGSYAG